MKKYIGFITGLSAVLSIILSTYTLKSLYDTKKQE